MPRFMEYKESTYRLLTLVVWALGLILILATVYGFAPIQANMVGAEGWDLVSLILLGLALVAIAVVWAFFLYWRLRVSAVRYAVKGLREACEAVLDDNGMGMLPRRIIVGDNGLRFEVVHEYDITQKNGHIDEVFGIRRYLRDSLEHTWTVFPHKITDQSREMLPIALLPSFNGLAFAMRGWVRLNLLRHFGTTSDHPRFYTDVDGGEKILPVSA